MPNSEQIKSAIRWLIATFGAAVATYIATKIGARTGDVLTILNSDAIAQFLTFVVLSLLALVWGLISRSEKNVAAAASAMPNVAGVITKDTPQGAALAKAVPDPAVTQAGSAKAKAIAK